MIKTAHRVLSSPLGAGLGWAMTSLAGAPLLAGAAATVLVWYSSTWPDLADTRYKGRYHPGIAVIRGSAHVGSRLRATRDEPPLEVDDGPAHCVEWALLAGLLVTVVTGFVPFLAPWSWWWGAAVVVGAGSHVAADWLTPTGVTGSAAWNAVVHQQVWRRHTLGWCDTDAGVDRYLLVPAVGLVTVLLLLGMVGWLGPVGSWLFGVSS